MREILVPAVPVWNIVLRTAVVYVVLLALLRLAGKREIGQMTTFDVVVILTIANAVQNAMVGPDTSLLGGLVAAAVLIGINWLVAAVGLRSLVFKQVLRGHPTLLVNQGTLLLANLQREGIDPDDVFMAMREHGIDSLAGVKLAVLETDGSISIIPAGAESFRTSPRHHMKALRKRE